MAYIEGTEGGKIYPVEAGSLEYAKEEIISAETSAEVLAVYVENYENVFEGTTLFILDSESVGSSIESVEGKIESTIDKIALQEEKIIEAEESRSEYGVYSESLEDIKKYIWRARYRGSCPRWSKSLH